MLRDRLAFSSNVLSAVHNASSSCSTCAPSTLSTEKAWPTRQRKRSISSSCTSHITPPHSWQEKAEGFPTRSLVENRPLSIFIPAYLTSSCISSATGDPPSSPAC